LESLFVVLNPEVPSDRLVDQLGKLISLSSGDITGLSCGRTRRDQAQLAQANLLHSMTWDKDGELHID